MLDVVQRDTEREGEGFPVQWIFRPLYNLGRLFANVFVVLDHFYPHEGVYKAKQKDTPLS